MLSRNIFKDFFKNSDLDCPPADLFQQHQNPTAIEDTGSPLNLRQSMKHEQLWMSPNFFLSQSVPVVDVALLNALW